MSLHKPVRLTFEILSDEAVEHFSIYSKREIQFILQAIVKHGSQVALYYGNRETFLLTTLVDVDRGGLWLEASQNADSNKRIANSRKFYFVSAHQHVKVQFVAEQIEPDDYDGLETFYMKLPHSLLRIQRREHFRQETPIANPLLCLVPLERLGRPGEFPVLDISNGGIALACSEHESELEEGEIYPDCRILLPDNVNIDVTIQVRNMFMISRPGGGTIKRVGCKFINLDGKTEILLQRFITQLQLNAIR
jgi:flagellar brake protein